MDNLDTLLEAEATLYRYQTAFIRTFTSIRDLDEKFPMDQEISLHLNACKAYYELYGTKDGINTPWVTGRRS